MSKLDTILLIVLKIKHRLDSVRKTLTNTSNAEQDQLQVIAMQLDIIQVELLEYLTTVQTKGG